MMEKKLLDEINQHFMSSQLGARVVESIDEKLFTITLKEQNFYGIGILNENDIEINDEFSNVRLQSQKINYEGTVYNLLVLSSSLHEHRQAFSAICLDFAKPGENNENRSNVVDDPVSWWRKWRELLGNISVEKRPYAVIAEMWLFKKELENQHPNVEWVGSKGKSHDIEGELYHIEVKSSVSQFNNEITISNQFQLDGEKPLYIAFVKLEESEEGMSINGLVKELVHLGVRIEEIEESLYRLRLPLGNTARQKKFKIIEARKYLVDEEFPIINANSFKDNKIPKHVKKISYTVDVSPFDYEVIKVE